MLFYKKILLTGFELGSSGVVSNRSANWATTTVNETVVYKSVKVIT